MKLTMLRTILGKEITFTSTSCEKVRHLLKRKLLCVLPFKKIQYAKSKFTFELRG